MENIPRLLDTIIKAPLWIFFAATIASGIPLLNLKLLSEFGITSNLRILDLPIAFYSLIGLSLFVSSAAARSLPTIKKYILNLFELFYWWLILYIIPKDSRAILNILEHEGRDLFYYDPNDRWIFILRDRDILVADFVSPRGTWTKYRLTARYKTAYYHHRPLFRYMLRSSPDSVSRVRKIMHSAKRSARSLSRS